MTKGLLVIPRRRGQGAGIRREGESGAFPEGIDPDAPVGDGAALDGPTVRMSLPVPPRESSERFGVPEEPSEQPESPGPPAPPESPRRKRSVATRRRRALLAVALAAVLLSVGGLVGATFVKSPADVAAQSKAPKADVLTAPVARQVLAATLVTRGTVTASTTIQVTPEAGQQSGAAAQVVTGVRKHAGDRIKPGDVLVEVSGRPVIALQGATPAYRDLRPDDDGKDVSELQKALKQLGYASGSDADGHFGPGTKQAVTDLYQHLGYDVPTTGGIGLDSPQSTDAPQLASAAQAVTQAKRTVDSDGTALGTAEQQLATDTAAKAPAATLHADHAAVTQAQTTLSYAQQDEQQAKDAQQKLIAATGPMLPLDEFVFLPTFPAQVTQFSAKVGDTVQAPLLTLACGQLQVSAQLEPDQGALLKAGMAVQIVAETLGSSATGKVSSVGTLVAPGDATGGGSGGTGGTDGPGGADASGGAGGDASGGAYVPVSIKTTHPLTAAWAGQDVRLTITSARTSAAALVVPLAAVSTGADGRTTVTVLAADGRTQRRVQVTTGLVGTGYVAVTPTGGGTLAAGDRVVIGQ